MLPVVVWSGLAALIMAGMAKKLGERGVCPPRRLDLGLAAALVWLAGVALLGDFLQASGGEVFTLGFPGRLLEIYSTLGTAEALPVAAVVGAIHQGLKLRARSFPTAWGSE